MKILPTHAGARRRARHLAGILLVDCLVYLAVFFVVVNLAFGALYCAWDAHRALRRSAEDIAAAVRTGEIWRADVRAATGPLQAATSSAAAELSIPQAGGSVVYRVEAGRVTRSTPNHPAPVLFLRNVKTSDMRPDPRGQVTPWVWEMELKAARPKARVRPLFTFIAVPPASTP